MSNDTPAQEPAPVIDAYQQGFIAAVLFLSGAGSPPTAQEFRDAMAKFAEYVKKHSPHLAQRH